MPLTFLPRGVDSDGVAQADMYITQGDDLSVTLTFVDDSTSVPLNFTGCAAALTVKAPGGTAAVLTFSTAATPATITLGGAGGTMVLAQTDTTTAALSPGEYVYDLSVTGAAPGSLKRTYLRGACTIIREVTT